MTSVINNITASVNMVFSEVKTINYIDFSLVKTYFSEEKTCIILKYYSNTTE